VWDELIKTVHDQTGAERISVMLYDVAEDALQIAAAIGMDAELMQEVSTRAGEKIAGWVLEQGEPVVLNGGPEDNPQFASFMKSHDIAAAISFPLKARDRTLGVLNVSKLGEAPPFSEVDIEMLSIICGQAVMAFENVRIMEERAERIRTRTILEQYVAPEVAEMLLKHGHNPLEVGEIREITVLFADIRNFTPLVTHLDLNNLRSFLNAFFDILSEIIFRFQGTLDKFMGDAVLAFFGAPIAIDKPQRAAAHAAVEMLASFKSLMEEWSGSKAVFDDIGLGIGIACGEVFLGNVGSQKRLDYTVIGSCVNLAQRLGAEAISGQILINENLQEIEGLSARIDEEPQRLLRGWDKPVRVFSVVPE
jgi:adenylate cyclase